MPTPEQALNAVGRLAAVAAGVFIVASLSCTRSGEQDIKSQVLCSKCGHSDELNVSKLEAQGRPARFPDQGPGYKCPKCGQHTLYMNPITCEKCGKQFLMAREAGGAMSDRCPKCGFQR